MRERKVTHTFTGASMKYEEMRKVLDRFEEERYQDPVAEFVQVNYRPGGETTSSQTTITFISRVHD